MSIEWIVKDARGYVIESCGDSEWMAEHVARLTGGTAERMTIHRRNK